MKFIIYGNLCKFIRNHKKCFFSFISRPILLELRTLNFYTEFWDFATLINYGNLCKLFKKKLLLLPHFLTDFHSVCFVWEARWRLQNLYAKFRNSLIMLIYANLFQKKITKNASSFVNWFLFGFFSFVSQPILIWFALSGRASSCVWDLLLYYFRRCRNHSTVAGHLVRLVWDPIGGPSLVHSDRMWSAVCSGAPHRQAAEGLRPQRYMLAPKLSAREISSWWDVCAR